MPLIKLPGDQEVWKDIKGFEGLYQVSNKGRVKSLDRFTSGKHLKGKLLSQKGPLYMAVDLWKDGKGHNKLVHRLVAEAFIPNPKNLPEVNHKDMNTSNNCVDNLEWVTVSYNTVHKNQNRPKGKSYRRKVRCLETGEVFASISASGRSVNVDATRIIESIQSHSCCKGFTFAYEDDIPENIEEYIGAAHDKYQDFHVRPNMKNSRKVRAIETSDVFDSIASAAKFYNCDTATITNRIKSGKAFNGVTLEFVE